MTIGAWVGEGDTGVSITASTAGPSPDDMVLPSEIGLVDDAA